MRVHSLFNLPSITSMLACMCLTAQAQTVTPPPVPGTPSAPTDAAICASAEDYLRCLEDIAMRETPECVDPYSTSCTSAREARALALDGVAERHGRRLCFLNGWPTCFTDGFGSEGREAKYVTSGNTSDSTFQYVGTTPNGQVAIINTTGPVDYSGVIFVSISPSPHSVLPEFSLDSPTGLQISFSPNGRWMLAIFTDGYSSGNPTMAIEMYDFMPPTTNITAARHWLNLLDYGYLSGVYSCASAHLTPCPVLPYFPIVSPQNQPALRCNFYHQNLPGPEKIAWLSDSRVEIHALSPSKAVTVLLRQGDRWYIGDRTNLFIKANGQNSQAPKLNYCDDMVNQAY